MDIANQGHVAAHDIEEVVLYVSPGAMHSVIGQPFRIKNSPHASAGFSAQYNVADVLVRGSSRPEHFAEKAITDPVIGDFLKKLSRAELTEGNIESARVRVIMKDGRQHDRFIEIARGDPRNPISKEELIDKFWTNIDFSQTVTRANAEKIVEMVEDLENLDSVRRLADLLAPASSAGT